MSSTSRGIHPAVAVGEGLHEHHGRRVVEVPARRQLDEIDRVTRHPGLHPRCSLLGVVDLGPAVAPAQIVRRVVVLHDAAVVEEFALQKEVDGIGTQLPPRRDIAHGVHAAEVGHQLDALVEDIGLLLARHGERVFMGVAVHPQLVAVLHDQFRFFREALDRMAGDVPRRLDAVALHHLQDSRHPLARREDAARDVAR